MTINELIFELQHRRDQHGGDAVVRTTWEGQTQDIDLSNIYFAPGGRWEGLFIDADHNSYKPDNAT